jgi:N6-adenosine-specific RNA methylase IME4
MNELPTVGGGFSCILADPPWHFNAYDGKGGLATNARKWGLAPVHYATTTTDELMQIPVRDVAAKDCALFMWVVDANMEQAFQLAEAWGFKFVTCAFVWVKDREGFSPWPSLGYWTRKQCEQLWMFKRGAPKRLRKDVEQIIFCKRGAHSAKPEIQYERIEALVGGPYLELFARTTRPNWSSWGNQVGVRDGLFGEPLTP